jgi:hypothetical protein
VSSFREYAAGRPRAFDAPRTSGLRLVVVAWTLGLVGGLFCSAAPAGAASQFGEPGNAAGQLASAVGVGVDQEAGDVYVGEFNNERVSKFDSAGTFLLAWGWKVNEEHPADELQTCTPSTGCIKGEAGRGAGQFASGCGAEGVAVDNNPLSSSYKDIYVADYCHYRVEKFDPEGKFLLMFGGQVNATTKGNICVAGETCTTGSAGTGDGEFEWTYEHSYVAVGPGGAVYVGDRARVQVFQPSGIWRENISLAGLSPNGKVTALAVDAAGKVYLADEGISGVREFEPGGIEKATQFDVGSMSIEAIALSKSGELFVADGSGGFHVAAYEANGSQLSSFGFKTASGTGGIAYSDSLNELYATAGGTVWVLVPPALGPTVENESATAELRGAASLFATVNPEGNSTAVHFEYVDDKHFQESGYASATSTSAQTIGSGFIDEHVEAHLPAKTLTPGVVYHWRAVAVDASRRKAVGSDQSLEETPAALVEGPWASNVAGTSATLSARIDPLGASTSYRLEYGLGSSYEHTFNGNVGEGMGYVQISYHIQGLQPLVNYHYRLVTESEVGSVEAVRAFTTQTASTEFKLPDGRAWELVSPPNKKAASIGACISGCYTLTEAANDGSGITYTVNEPIGEGTIGHIFGAQILSIRTSSGWRTENVAARADLPPEGESAKNLFAGGELWHVFSQDLTLGLLEPGTGDATPQSPEATERTLYLRHNAAGTMQPLENAADVPSGLKFGDQQMVYFTGTPDLSHVVFGTQMALTPEAIYEESCKGCFQPLNLYEWHAGHFELVNILPDGTTKPGAFVGNYYQGAGGGGMTAHAISDDGRWIVWKYGQLVPEGEKVKLYVRDMVDKRTFKVGGPFARFETMSSDGSKVFYVETKNGLNGDLYLFDTKTGTKTDLTANHGSGERNAGVQNAVLGSSRDGSYIYFVATGVLAGGAVSGQYNLYLLHEEAGSWNTALVAVLSKEDEHTWGGTNEGRAGPDAQQLPWLVNSEVSPNGRYVAFMSNSPLTGYDNRDAVSGQRDEEVYLYDAISQRLICASCNPTGARPVGVFDQGETENSEPLLVDQRGTWTKLQGLGSNHWLAGSLVGWNNELNLASYEPRYVSDEGRLFFDSPDALVPQDTNGVEDVYEYEPAGVGSCTHQDTSFGEASGGCVSLISSGQSSAESAFMDASETGGDVFFVTSKKLVGEDYDNAYDMYDAHICTSGEPCRTEPVSPPECTSGDSCKVAPSSQPTIFGPTPSATFKGTGNVTIVSSSKSSVAPRSVTRAQKLVRALRACRKKTIRGRRLACERQARSRFGAKQSRTAKAIRRGNR